MAGRFSYWYQRPVKPLAAISLPNEVPRALVRFKESSGTFTKNFPGAAMNLL